jgi:hypothetical protein
LPDDNNDTEGLLTAGLERCINNLAIINGGLPERAPPFFI